MAKKSKAKKTKNNKKAVVVENALPQNILAFGERVEEDKNVYILQKVYKEIHRFTEDKTENESGGILVGEVIEEFGKSNIIIHGFIEAKYSEGTPTTLTFTHDSWNYIHEEVEKKFPKYQILGWIHTHPNFGIFLSEYDKFIHENFFSKDNQVAYVVDPIQGIEGFYFWINGKLERCKGFYVFDKSGKKISLTPEKKEGNKVVVKRSMAMNFIVAVLCFIVALLTIWCVTLDQEVQKLKKEYDMLFTPVEPFYYSYTPSYNEPVGDEELYINQEEYVQDEGVVEEIPPEEWADVSVDEMAEAPVDEEAAVPDGEVAPNE